MRRNHFTLIEIMIVVAIIALLALIALPNFIQARRSARNTTCIANLKQIEGAKHTWSIQTNQSEDATPDSGDLNGYFTGGVGGIFCPIDNTKSFDNSYAIGDLNTIVTCEKDATNHFLGGAPAAAANN